MYVDFKELHGYLQTVAKNPLVGPGISAGVLGQAWLPPYRDKMRKDISLLAQSLRPKFWGERRKAQVFGYGGGVFGSVVQSESTGSDLLVFPFWPIFSHGPKRLTF